MLIGIVAAAACAPAACRRSAGPRAQEQVVPAASWFEDVTEERGFAFTHAVAKSGDYFMPDSVGSGLALFDFNNDGRLDLYLVQNAGAKSTSTNTLFRQQPNGHFEDFSHGSGLDVAGNGMGVACGDVNNDGWTDVVVTEYRAVRLFLNEGGARFRELTEEAGLDNPFWAISASFLDYDRDGWLDLVIANYVDYDPHRPCFDESGQREFCGPKTFPPGSITKLFHNRGSAGGARFEDVTALSGLGAAAGPGLGVLCADFDGDGWVDIFVANDGEQNRLWINRHDGTFRDEAVTRGIAFNMMGQAQGNMGIALADFDGDNAFDVFVTHLIEETHALWTQGPRGLFQDRTAVSRLGHPLWHGTGFGTVAEDFDNDGAPDIAIVNGAVRRNKLRQPDASAHEAVGPFWAPYAERNQLFANDGRGVFRDMSVENPSFCGIARVARGLVWGDLDGDGGIDLAVSHIANRARVFRNVAPARGNWLLVRVVDPELGGRDAYGAEVTVHTAQRRWTRWCNPGASYASSNDPRAHFGLGAISKIDSLEVIWPDGAREQFSVPSVNQSIVVRKGGGSMKP